MRMALRRTKSGARIWYAIWQDETGKWCRQSLRTQDKRTAERNFLIWQQERTKAQAPNLTVADCWQFYWERHAKHKTSARDRASVWKNLSRFFGDRLWDTVNEDVCRAYMAHRTQDGGVKPATVWSELKTLRTSFAYCAQRGMVPKSPFVWLPNAPQPRDLRLTRQQAEALIAACDLPHVKLFVILALTTAGRMRAILDLTWDRVDFARGTVALRDPTKDATSKGRATVPMNNLARAALQEAKAGALTAHVIEWGGHRLHDIHYAVKAAGARIGLPWVGPHIMRHTAATLMVEAGVPLEMVGQYLGHTNIAVTYRTYARFQPNAMREAAAALEFGTVQQVRRKA